MEAFQCFQQTSLTRRPCAASIRELLCLSIAPCTLWSYESGRFKLVLQKNAPLHRKFLKQLVQRGVYHLFIAPQDRPLLEQALRTGLTQVSRALSMGDAVINATHQMSLLTLNMGRLYRNPGNDEALGDQYRNARGLIQFLWNHRDHGSKLYRQYAYQGHHYTIGHPLLSSLMLVYFLDFLGHFDEQEVELLFLVNYFKDIGNALIPQEILSQKGLSSSQQELVARHPCYSVEILKGRIPLASHYLNIIAYHHDFPPQGIAFGTETVLLQMVDMITAMISSRPYRNPINLFVALNIIKVSFPDNYQLEFQYLIQFLQKFLS